MLSVPVLFIVFNRPRTTAKVFDEIKNARPKKLYISCDAPRAGNREDYKNVQEVLKIVSHISWESDVKVNLNEKNLGINNAVISSLNWFFSHETNGIILEDDCLPNKDFFYFCQNLLSRYEFNERIWQITGNNFQYGKTIGKDSYYFSKYNHIWGWATWKRAWENFDEKITFWPELKSSSRWRNLFYDQTERKYWETILDSVYNREFMSWDYAWTASVWNKNALTATPNVNLVSNIGFGSDATNTKSKRSKDSRLSTSSIFELSHPNEIEFNPLTDVRVFNRHFGGNFYRFPLKIISAIFRKGRILKKAITGILSKI